MYGVLKQKFNEYLLDKRVEKKHLGTAPYFSIHTKTQIYG